MKRIFGFALGVCLVIVTITVCAVVLMNRAGAEAGRTAREALDLARSVLHITPEVHITNHVATQQTRDILELATVEQQYSIEQKYEMSWLGSTKRLRLQGRYAAKAGFDLKDRFRLDIDQDTGVVHADFPGPRVLSVELQSYEVIEDDSGYWNRLNPQDQELAFNTMNEQARKHAVELGMLNDAKASLTRSLEELAKRQGQKWEIVYRDGE
ncbi:MAG: DUF4230 domain-containing protein [Phycisphaeraceae bacterium]